MAKGFSKKPATSIQNSEEFHYDVFCKVYNSLVATPTISASNGSTKYIISGDTVTLTCSSTSDSGGTGTYEWKKDSQKM